PRRLHRRHRRPARKVPGGGRGDALPRRGGRDPPRPAAQAAARAGEGRGGGGGVPLRAAHFLAEACGKNRIRAKILSESALALLRSHAWPGNVRELRNAMERVAILVAEPVLEP